MLTKILGLSLFSARLKVASIIWWERSCVSLKLGVRVFQQGVIVTGSFVVPGKATFLQNFLSE